MYCSAITAHIRPNKQQQLQHVTSRVLSVARRKPPHWLKECVTWDNFLVIMLRVMQSCVDISNARKYICLDYKVSASYGAAVLNYFTTLLT